jgi:hypothetical protein
MAKVTPVNTSNSRKSRRPGLTPEADENQLIALAMDLVEKRLRDGSASSQETTHFLKLATAEARLKNKLLEAQTEMALAKKAELESRKHSEELLQEAIAAFKSYSPSQSDPIEDDRDEY